MSTSVLSVSADVVSPAASVSSELSVSPVASGIPVSSWSVSSEVLSSLLP